MRPLFALALLIASLCSVAHAEMLSRRAFAEKFVEAAKTALPATTVTLKNERELSIKYASGRDVTFFLDNAYKDYLFAPERLDHVLRSYDAAIAQPAPTTKVDRTRIVPVIKDREWLTELEASLRARGTEPPEHLVEDFNSQLIIVYAEDDPARMRYLTTKDGVDVPREDLRKLAVANLQRLLPKIKMESDEDGFSLLNAGGDYEASLLLFDEMWSSGQFKVKGDIVVAVPARDVLLVTGSQNRAGLKKMRAFVAAAVAKAPHRLTAALFVYRDGKFKTFGRTPSPRASEKAE